MSCDTCLKSSEIEAIKSEIKEIKANREKDKEEMFSIREMILEMRGDIKLINKTVNDMSDVINILRQDTEELKNKPYKKFDKVTIASISTLVGLILKSAYDFLMAK